MTLPSQSTCKGPETLCFEKTNILQINRFRAEKIVSFPSVTIAKPLEHTTLGALYALFLKLNFLPFFAWREGTTTVCHHRFTNRKLDNISLLSQMLIYLHVMSLNTPIKKIVRIYFGRDETSTFSVDDSTIKY